MLNRRAFFGRALGAFAAALASPALLELSQAPAPHLDAELTALAYTYMEDGHPFTAISFAPFVAPRFDVIYGVGVMGQPWMCDFAVESTPRGNFAAYLEADRAIQMRVRYLDPAVEALIQRNS